MDRDPPRQVHVRLHRQIQLGPLHDSFDGRSQGYIVQRH